MLQINFIFTLCQVGAEKVLKSEIKRNHPNLTPAFSRPGFVTFKISNALDGQKEFDIQNLKSIFARTYGYSLKKVTQAKEVIEVAQELFLKLKKPLTLHLYSRDQYPPGEEPANFDPKAWEKIWIKRLVPLTHETHFLKINDSPHLGDPVLDVVIVEETELWIGWHLHHMSYPKIEAPQEAPSRAYIKLEEAIVRFDLPLKFGDQALEIGSAPGGAAYALLKRGIDVIGIDPGGMSPVVTGYKGKAKFFHISEPVSQVRLLNLPKKVQWLLLDMNVKPAISLYALDRFAIFYKPTLLGMILTLKLNDWKMASEIPAWFKQIREMGISQVRGAQLVSNKQEICVVALTKKGLIRRLPLKAL